MSQPYVGECRAVGFNFQINGWNYCNGALLAISQNDTLFNLIGTTYGGDGVSTFAVPDLQGRVPVHQGPGFVIGQKAGVEIVTLTASQMPVHPHSLNASGANGNSNSVGGNVLAACPTQAYVSGGAPDTPMNPLSLQSAGGSQPHENLQPYLTINWVISLFGIFPSQ